MRALLAANIQDQVINMTRVNGSTIDRPAAELLAEARERLAVAHAAVNKAATVYNQRGTAGDGVALREARVAFDKAQNECAALEDRAVAEADAARETARKVAKGKILKLTARREELAKRTDALVEELTGVVTDWLALDDEIFTTWPGHKNRIPTQLGRSRVLGILREATARVGTGILSNDISRSQAGAMRSASDIAADDTKLLNSAI